MSNRVTEKQLEAIVRRINQITDSPEESYTKDSAGQYQSNIGNYHLDHAYGGVSLHRMVNESGGVNNVLGCGHIPKSELADLMYAYIRGLEDR